MYWLTSMTRLLVIYSKDCPYRYNSINNGKSTLPFRPTNGGRSLKYYVGQGRRTLGWRCHFTFFIVDFFGFFVAQQQHDSTEQKYSGAPSYAVSPSKLPHCTVSWGKNQTQIKMELFETNAHALHLPRFSSAAKHTGYTINAINNDSTVNRSKFKLTIGRVLERKVRRNIRASNMT